MKKANCSCPTTGRYDQKVAWENVQSIVRRPYSDWKHSAHLVLTIENPGKARRWLSGMLDDFRMAGEIYRIDNPLIYGPKADKPLHFNIAFTVDGLLKLGVCEDDLSTFDPAFVEGMAPEPKQPDGLELMPPEEQMIRKQGTTRRAGLLGDIHENHSSKWIWGGTKTTEKASETPDTKHRVLQHDVHILLMVFAHERKLIDGYIKNLLAGANGITDKVAKAIGGTPIQHETRHTGREHFGFRDGISQPLFPDSHKAKTVDQRWRELHQVAAGEFVLGYLNERDERAEVPSIKTATVQGQVLPHKCVDCQKLDKSRLDFGHNGSYLVARQLDQDVAAFDAMVERAANLIATDVEKPPRRKAAELLVGRGVEGAPLSDDVGPAFKQKLRKSGNATDASGSGDKCVLEYNDFTYFRTDQAGMRCPIGSHVRRTNPRDSLEPNPGTSLSLSKQHRILRRGRIYGEAVAPMSFMRHRCKSKEVGELMRRPRGLFFICLNTDIAGQFEFIQDTWINNPNFGDLEGERDPLLAASVDTRVSLPSKPFTRWFRRDKPPVRVRGGAYFFLPGKQALKALSLMTDHACTQGSDDVKPEKR